MARLRNPRYAPEFLEKRLSPSGGMSLSMMPSRQVALSAHYSASDPPPPPPPPKPGDPDPAPPLPPGGP